MILLTNANPRIEIYDMRLLAILDKCQRLIERGDARMADLARFLGKNWNQCHEWIVKRNHQPNAEVALGMLEFIATHDKSSGEEIAYEGDRLIVNGRQLTQGEYDLWMENQMLKTMLASRVGKNDEG